MKKKPIWALLSGVILIILVYLASMFYYEDRFGPGSHISNVNVSGMTYDEVVESIHEQLSNHTLTVKENGDIISEVQLNELGTFDHEEVIDKAWQERNKYLLSRANRINTSFNFTPVSGISENEFLELIHIDNSSRKESKDAYINDSLEVTPETYGNQVDAKKVYELFSQNNSEIDIKEAYIKPQKTSDDKSILEAKSKLDEILSQELTLKVKKESVAVPQDLIEEGLVYNNDSNKISFDKTVLSDWLDSVNHELMPYQKPFEFTSTLRGDVVVDAGTLGWAIDTESTLSKLNNAILNMEGTVEADLIDDNYDLSKESGSYIEVDLENQTMFVYVNGELKVETDIVSGMAATEPATPTVPGAYQVWNMESPSVLVGENMQLGTEYSQPVNYWIPFDYTGQGIHDANWQPAFGGDNYLYSGSQGCVNTPPDVMVQVYELVEVGFPVMVF